MSRVMRSREERELERVSRAHGTQYGTVPASHGEDGEIRATSFVGGRKGVQVKADGRWTPLPEVSGAGSFGFTVGNPVTGPVITTGTKGYLRVPYDCEVTGWSILANPTGSLTVDLRYSDWADGLPWPADTIVGTTPPELVSASSAKNDALVDWATTMTRGGIISCVVTACTDIQYFTLNVSVTRKE